MLEGDDRPFLSRTGQRVVYRCVLPENIDSLRNKAAEHAFKRNFTDEELRDLVEARTARSVKVFLMKHSGMSYRMYETKMLFFEEFGDLEEKHARVSYPKGEGFSGVACLELFDPYLPSNVS